MASAAGCSDGVGRMASRSSKSNCGAVAVEVVIVAAVSAER